MMNSLRNVQDATPLGVDFAFASRLGMRMADELAHVRGRPVLPVFEKFGGGYIEVPSVFGRTGDCVLVKPGPGLYAEHAHSPALDVAALNEVLAEAVGTPVPALPGRAVEIRRRRRHGRAPLLADRLPRRRPRRGDRLHDRLPDAQRKLWPPSTKVWTTTRLPVVSA